MSVALNKALNDKILVANLGKTRTALQAIVQSIADRVLQGDSQGNPPANEPVQQGKGFQTRPQSHSPHRCRRQQSNHSASLGDSITPSTQTRFSV
jgi:hypothetical protein